MSHAKSNPIGFVYMWTNVLNDKKYIGSHIGTIDDGYVGSGELFKKAIKKYGIDSFKREILAECFSVDEVRNTEESLINKFNAAQSDEFYNLRSKVGGGFEYINNHPNRQLFLDKIGKKAKQRLSNKDNHPRGMKNKHHTDQKKQQISNSMINLKRGTPVLKFDMEWNFIEEFDSLALAAKSVNGKISNIKYTIEGKHKFAYGFKWKYKN